MVEEREECVAQPAEHDALCMGIADATPAEPRRTGANLRSQQLDRRKDAKSNRYEQRRQGGQSVSVDEGGLDFGTLCASSFIIERALLATPQ